MSIRGYARHKGVSHPAVLKAIDTGRITVRKDGKIDSAVADRQWALNTNLSKPRNAITGNPRSPLDGISGGRTSPGSDEERIISGLNAARSMREAFAAKREKLAYEREVGLYVPLADVKAQAFEAGRRVRSALQMLPNRLAPLVVGVTTVEEAHTLIAKEVRRALEGLEKLEQLGGK